MARRIPFLGFFLTLLILGASAHAETLLDAPLSYSATRTVTVDGRTYNGTVHHIPGKERQDQKLMGVSGAFILDAGADKGWFVVPALHSVIAFPFPPVMSMLASPVLKKTRIGPDAVNGYATTKYRIHTAAEDGTTADGFAWFSKRGVLMKLQGVVIAKKGHRTEIEMALSDVAEGPQDAALFVPPPDYTQLPAEALQPFLGKPPA